MTLKQKRWTLFAVINGLVLLCIPLYHLYVHQFLPLVPDFMTKCVAVRFLHLYCTGCGGTRAIGALFNGDLLGSLRLNPFVPHRARRKIGCEGAQRGMDLVGGFPDCDDGGTKCCACLFRLRPHRRPRFLLALAKWKASPLDREVFDVVY